MSRSDDISICNKELKARTTNLSTYDPSLTLGTTSQAIERIGRNVVEIDFCDAQALWDDQDLLEIKAKMADEPRYLVIGLIGSKHWSSVINYRGEKISLISVRRSRKREVELYES